VGHAAAIEDEERRGTMLARTAVSLQRLRRDLMSMSSDIAALDARLTTAEGYITGLRTVAGLVWNNTAEQTLTGAIGSTETIFGDPGVEVEIPANTLQNNDRLLVRGSYQVLAVVGGTFGLCRIRWGGLTGQSLTAAAASFACNTSTGLGEIEALLTFRAVGASPNWHYRSTHRALSNTTYDGLDIGFAKTTQPTNAAVRLTPTVAYSGGAPVAGDTIRWRTLSAQVLRAVA
jgi:hypothetical protein